MSAQQLPHVVAVMITGKARDRLPWALAAIERFAQQTYPVELRTLLIVQDLDSMQPLFSQLPPNCVEQYTAQVPLGGLRNYALDWIRDNHPGSWVMQWDDDDIVSRDRMQQHVAEVLPWVSSHRKPAWASTLRQQLRYNTLEDSAVVYRGDAIYGVFGTVLHSLDTGGARYEVVGRHEDSRFLKCFKQVLPVTLPPSLYTRLYNGHNTWDQRHIMGVRTPAAGAWRRRSKHNPISEADAAVLAENVDMLRQKGLLLPVETSTQ